MKRLVSVGVLAVVIAGGLTLTGRAQPGDAPPREKQKQETPTGKQVLMRDKLTFAKDALDGLSVEDYDKIARSAQMLRMISRAASWYVLDSAEYDRFSKDFQEQAADLERHARAKNLDAAALDYVRISLTCVQCHKYVREVRGKKAKP